MGRLRDSLEGTTGSAYYGTKKGLKNVAGGARGVSGFLWRQTKGTYRRTRNFAGWVTLDRVIPEGIAGTIQEVIELIPQAFGVRGTPQPAQFGAVVTLLILAIAATFLSGGLLIGTVIVLGGLLLASLIRLNPTANRLWLRATDRLPIKRDYDIIGWERD